MIVRRLIKNKNHTYSVNIDGTVYQFNEETIIKYRLVEGKELTKETLIEALKKDELAGFYTKALNYAVRYGKNQAEVSDYLREKGLMPAEISGILQELIRIRALDDNRLCVALTDSLVRNANGRIRIEAKLKERRFSAEQIAQAVEGIDRELYMEVLSKLYDKIKDKYKDEPFVKKMKIQRYLFGRGYTYADIDELFRSKQN